MAFSKDALQKLVRPLAVKWVTRGALWLLTAKLGYEATVAESDAAQLGAAGGVVACVLVSLALDWWHNRKDRGGE